MSARAWSYWLTAFVLAGVAWRLVRYVVVFPMWGDEAFVAVEFLRDGWSHLWQRLEYDMVAPLGWLLATKAVSECLGPGEAALRLVSWLAGFAAFLLFIRFALRWTTTCAALAAIAIFAASYYPVRHAAEVKPYAMDLFVAVVVLALAWGVHNRPGPGRWFAFMAAIVVGVWFSYPSVFISGGALLALAPRAAGKRAAPPWRWWLAGGLLCLSFAGMYALVGRAQQWQLAPEETGQWARWFPPWSEPWRMPLWLLEAHAGNLFAYPNGGPRFGSTATFLLVVVGSVATWRLGKKRFLALLLAPLPLMFLAATLGKYPYGGSARTNLHLAPAICLLAGIGVAALVHLWRAEAMRRATWVGVLGFLGLLLAASAIRDGLRPYKSAADVAARTTIVRLAGEMEAGEPWLMFGRFNGEGVGPNMRSWGGSAARLRYQIESRREGPLLEGWAAAAVPAPRPGRPLRVLAYRDEEAVFPEAAWLNWLAELGERFGSPRLERISFGAGKDALEVATFAGGGRASTTGSPSGR